MITARKIQQIASNRTIYNRGLAYFREGNVSPLKVSDEGTEKKIIAEVRGSEPYCVKVVLEEDEEKIKMHTCTCKAHETYRGACKHVVATLLKYIRGDAVKETYKEEIIQPVIAKQPLSKGVVLSPKVYIDEQDNFFLGAEIGTTTTYMVQDMYALGQAIYNEGTTWYGEDLYVKHTLDSFVEESRPFASFIAEQTAELLRYNNFKSMFDRQDRLSKTMHLSISGVRRFFNLYDGKCVTCYMEKYGHACLLNFTQDAPPILLRAQQDETSITLNFNVPLGEITILNKAVDQYLIVGEGFYKLNNDFIRGILPFLKNALYNTTTTKDSKTIVMPKGKVQFTFKENTIDQFLAPILQAKLYFDRQEDGHIVLKVNYIYGETIINPYIPIELGLNSVLRDREKEKLIQNMIENYGFYEDEKGSLTIKGDDDIYRLLKVGIEEFMTLAEVYISDALKKVKIKTPGSMTLGVRLTEDLLELDVVSSEMTQDEILMILREYHLRKKFYKLKNGDYISLENLEIQEIVNVLEALNLEERAIDKTEITLPRYRALYLEQLLKASDHVTVKKDSMFEEMIETLNSPSKAEFEVPKALQPILRDYQKTGYKWLGSLANYGFGGILADDMGLGKTLQVIALLQGRKVKRPTLIVCPTSLVLNWKKEFEKFAPDVSLLIMTGGVNERQEKIKTLKDYSIVVTSYELLKRDLQQYKGYHFSYCILDEAQYIKNNATQNAKSVKKIKSDCRIALTGTPIENTLTELWSIFDFIMPGYLLAHRQFRDKIEIPIVKNNDEKAMARLRKMIAPFILRRIKKDVLTELPEKTQTVLYTDMNGKQKKLYEAYVIKAKREVLEALEDNSAKGQFRILASLTRLRQLCCHPALFLEDYEGGSAKLSATLELVQNAVESGHKILLFSQFTTMLDLIAESFKDQGISYSMLTGSVKASERMALVEDFNTSDTAVFLISLKAGGVGLNLTSADIVIHYDPWWNTSVQNQATDRAYRIGQTNPVQVFELITKDSIEEKIKIIQDKKNNLTENILTTGGTLFNSLSREDIMALIEGMDG